MAKYLVEFKQNGTNQTQMRTLTEVGEKFVQKYESTKLDSNQRTSVLNEIQKNYLTEAIDETAYTIHMVSDMDMSQVV